MYCCVDADEVINDVAPEPPAPRLEEEDAAALEPQPAPGRAEKEAPRQPLKPRRKKPAPGQRLRRDAQHNKISTDEVREMLKNRKPLFRQRLPLVALPMQQRNWLDTDDLDVLMQPRSLREEHLNPDMQVLLKSIGTCKPVSFFAFMGDSAGAEKEAKRVNETHDEIEYDEEAAAATTARVPHKRKAPDDAQENQEDVPDIEVLRNATPIPLAGQDVVVAPHGDPAGDVPGGLGTTDREHDVQQVDDAMLDASQIPMDDVPPPMDTDIPPPMDEDFPQPPPEDLGNVPPHDPEDAAVPGPSQQEQELPFDPVADGPSQNGAHEMEEEMWGRPAMPASQPNEDTSLNPHTVLTLSRLQELAQVR
jgi:hypothetical protein